MTNAEIIARRSLEALTAERAAFLQKYDLCAVCTEPRTSQVHRDIRPNAVRGPWDSPHHEFVAAEITERPAAISPALRARIETTVGAIAEPTVCGVCGAEFGTGAAKYAHLSADPECSRAEVGHRVRALTAAQEIAIASFTAAEVARRAAGEPGHVQRCGARHPMYPKQVRCEEAAGHSGRHGHSFFARYWSDEPESETGAVCYAAGEPEPKLCSVCREPITDLDAAVELTGGWLAHPACGPRYPTSAELATFRRSYFPLDNGRWGAINPATNRPILPFGLDHADGGRAWIHELQSGIGTTTRPERVGEARRGANADRSAWSASRVQWAADEARIFGLLARTALAAAARPKLPAPADGDASTEAVAAYFAAEPAALVATLERRGPVGELLGFTIETRDGCRFEVPIPVVDGGDPARMAAATETKAAEIAEHEAERQAALQTAEAERVASLDALQGTTPAEADPWQSYAARGMADALDRMAGRLAGFTDLEAERVEVAVQTLRIVAGDLRELGAIVGKAAAS
jgi:hypothetical protein